MDNRIILLDTSILIDLFRKKNKQKTVFYNLSKNYSKFAVSTITRFEIFVGQIDIQTPFWDNFYKKISIYDFDDLTAYTASSIVKQLKSDNKIIEISDILIAATAISRGIQLATLNLKHFERIKNLQIVNI